MGVIYLEGMDSDIIINDSEREREKPLQAPHPVQPRAYTLEGLLCMCNTFCQ